MTQANLNKRFFDFMERRPGSPEVLVAPIFGANFCAGWRGQRWIPPSLDQESLEALIACGQAAGVLPIICLGWWDLNPFGWTVRELGRDERHRRYAWEYQGRVGTFRQVFEDRPEIGVSVVEFPVRSVDDHAILDEMFDRMEEHRERLVATMRGFMDQVGGSGVLYLNVSLPHLVFGFVNDQQLIYDLIDHPQSMHTLFEKCQRAAMRLIEWGMEAGIRLVFCGTHGILGPNILREHMLPYAAQWRETLHRHRAFLYLHECGKMRALIEEGLYNELRPDILEGFDRSPVGDVDDLRWARERLDPRIVFKGNLRLEDVKTGPPSQIQHLCQETLDVVRGYRHILGTSCSLLWGTSMEHVKVFSEFAEADR